MKTKNCETCETAHSILFRIKKDSTKKWYFLCRACTEKNKKRNANYRYGGTWKG